jgi:hypothetical protein
VSDESSESTPTAPSGLSAAEMELRRYEARLGVWKVVLGTFIVGLAGVLIPGAISFYTAYFDNERKKAEFELSQQAAHQQYIKDFFATAINQDIELRIRFADYFANLSGPQQEGMWRNYLTSLRELRDRNRETINKLEKQLVGFKRLSQEEIDVAEFDRINRELTWANSEVGYIATERSAVFAVGESPIGKKVRLYREATELVHRLAVAGGPLAEDSAELTRFWDLHNKDLIGVESSDFARKMVDIGGVLKSPTYDAPKVKVLAVELINIARRELGDLSQAGLQQEQQQYQQQQQQQQQQQPQYQQQQQLLAPVTQAQ